MDRYNKLKGLQTGAGFGYNPSGEIKLPGSHNQTIRHTPEDMEAQARHLANFKNYKLNLPDNYGEPQMNQPSFAGIKNTVQGRDNSNFNKVEQDVNRRDQLQENLPTREPASIPSPYMQKKEVTGGPAMNQPQVEATDLNPPSMQMNQPLDDEDLMNLGIAKK